MVTVQLNIWTFISITTETATAESVTKITDRFIESLSAFVLFSILVKQLVIALERDQMS